MMMRVKPVIISSTAGRKVSAVIRISVCSDSAVVGAAARRRGGGEGRDAGSAAASSGRASTSSAAAHCAGRTLILPLRLSIVCLSHSAKLAAGTVARHPAYRPFPGAAWWPARSCGRARRPPRSIGRPLRPPGCVRAAHDRAPTSLTVVPPVMWRGPKRFMPRPGRPAGPARGQGQHGLQQAADGGRRGGRRPGPQRGARRPGGLLFRAGRGGGRGRYRCGGRRRHSFGGRGRGAVFLGCRRQGVETQTGSQGCQQGETGAFIYSVFGSVRTA
jgi:hypothetical protein